MHNRLPTILSTAALVVSMMALCLGGAIASGVLVGSKQIRNGSVKSIDLRNDGVKSPDLAPASVESQALALPEPTECQVKGEVKSHPTTAFSKLADVCVYTKTTAESVLEVNWTGSVEGHNAGEASGCVFQLRVNGQPSAPGGGGETFGRGLVSVSASALFGGLPVGPLTVEVWARLAMYEPTSMGGPDANACTLGPRNAGTNQTIDVSEAVT